MNRFPRRYCLRRVCQHATVLGGLTLGATGAVAQITLDGTLGPAGPLSGPDYQIPAELGQQHGGNLFHSFGLFNIHGGESATFSGPNSIVNIIGRVTGGEASWIDGPLRSTIPDANLYLLNPAGVMFGENARLDVQGSFHVSTADYLRLGESGRFDARAPDNSLLGTAPPSAFGFLSPHPAPITVHGSALEVPVGQSLSLVGGDIELTQELATSSNLFAPSGRINIASVASSGEVIPNGPDQPAGLNMEGFEQLGHIRVSTRVPPDPIDPSDPSGPPGLSDLQDQWKGNISTSGDPGGTIVIRGGQLTFDHGYIASNTVGSVDHPGVGVDIEIMGDIALQGEIAAWTLGEGRGGGIRIAADHLNIEGWRSSVDRFLPSAISTVVLGSGEGGNIELTTHGLLLNGALISTEVWGSGTGGDLTLHTAALEMQGDQSFTVISTATSSTGDAGNLTVVADEVVIRGGAGLAAGITTSTAGSGTGGDLTLHAGHLQIQGDQGPAFIQAVTIGTGDAGDLTVVADEVVIRGGSESCGLSTAALPQIPSSASAGDLRVIAGSIQLLDGAYITAGVFSGAGDGGSIEITADELLIRGGAGLTEITALTAGSGTGGDLTLHTGRLQMQGDQGPVIIGTSTFGTGDAGNLTVVADEVVIRGGSELCSLNTQAIPQTPSSASAGDIQVIANSIQLLDGAQINAGVFSGAGDGGSIEITADTIVVEGTNADGIPAAIGSESGGDPRFFQEPTTGDGGDIRITAQTLQLTESGGISAGSNSLGNPGDIDIQVGDLDISNNGFITNSNRGLGEIAGTITIDADRIRLAGPSSENGFTGIFSLGRFSAPSAGDIFLHANSLQIVDGAEISVVTEGPGAGGTVTIDADRVLIAGEDPINQVPARIDARTVLVQGFEDHATGRGGDIVLRARELDLRDGGQITTASESAGDGGNITLSTARLTLADGASISARSTRGADAGSITITARDHLQSQGGTITTEANQGAGGNIEIQAPELVTLIDSDITTSVAGGDADAGNITIAEPAALTLVEGSRINANTFDGRGGFVRIRAGAVVRSPDSEIKAEAESRLGIDGEVNIDSPAVDLTAGLVSLPAPFFDATRILTKPCAERWNADAIRLTMRRYDALPDSPYGLRAAFPAPAAAWPAPAEAASPAGGGNWLMAADGCPNEG